MTINKAVHRLHNDLSRLRKAEHEQKSDRRDLGHDRHELKKDRKQGDRDHATLKKDAKSLDRAGQRLTKDVTARDKAMNGLAAQRQAITDQLNADTFDYDPNTEGVQQNPALLQQLADVTEQQTDTGAKFQATIDGDRQAKTDARAKVTDDRKGIVDDRKEQKHDRAVIKHDHHELKHDKRAIKSARHTALKHLRPAEYHMGLKSTNRVRHELGLKSVHDVIRPGVPNTVGGQIGSWIAKAQTILKEHGISLSKMPARDIATIIRFESGGNPNAQNNWDSNAAAGHPSIGLMQTIGPTFNSYKLPGHGNIRNPIDNIIAGVRYAISRYGSISNVPGIVAVHHGGQYVGY
jgi:hypothetical protein